MRARASSLSWRLVPLAGPLDGGLRLGVARGRLHRRTIRVFAFQHAPYLFELRDFLVDCAKDFLSCYAPQGTASGSSRFSAYPKNGQLLLARSSSSLPHPRCKVLLAGAGRGVQAPDLRASHRPLRGASGRGQAVFAF